MNEDFVGNHLELDHDYREFMITVEGERGKRKIPLYGLSTEHHYSGAATIVKRNAQGGVIHKRKKHFTGVDPQNLGVQFARLDRGEEISEITVKSDSRRGE